MTYLRIIPLLAVIIGTLVVPVRADIVPPPPDVVLVAADFLGTGTAQAAMFNRSERSWYIQRPCPKAPCEPFEIEWGGKGDIPFAADVDGDRRAELILYRPSEGHWYILNLNCVALTCNVEQSFTWGGMKGDLPYVADFDGDGRADLVICRTLGDFTWWVLRSNCENGAYTCYATIPGVE